MSKRNHPEVQPDVLGHAYEKTKTRLAPGATPRDVRQTVGELAEDFENILKHVDKGAPLGSACKRGCSSCCHLVVHAWAPEILRLAMHISRYWPKEAQDGLRERLRVRLAKQVGRSAEDLQSDWLPCTMLDVAKGECQAHDHRPLACIGWTSNDLSVCERNLGRDANDLADTPAHPFPSGYKGSLDCGIAGALDDLGLCNENYEFNSALSRALDADDIKHFTRRWLDGEDVFHGCLAKTGFASEHLPGLKDTVRAVLKMPGLNTADGRDD